MNDIKIHRPQIQNFSTRKEAKISSGRKFIPKEHQDFAKSMEAQFNKLMLKEMEKTIQSNSKSSTAKDFYGSLLLRERSNSMAGRGASKLQDMILKEVYPVRFRNKANYDLFNNSKNKYNHSKIEMHDKPSLNDKVIVKSQQG